jgi:alkyl sulfatase BDS1-like metallo-beta-lactamase superfamily hydrolase
MELDGSLDVAIAQQRLMAAIASPDLLAALPASAIVEGLSTRLKAELVSDVEMAVLFEMTNTGETFGMQIRRGIAQFYTGDMGSADARIKLGIGELHQLIAKSITVDQAVQNGVVEVTGDATAVSRFFDYFENPTPINLTVR